MPSLLQDLRYGARVLVKSPAFSLVAIIVLALGIGANTAIFSVVNAVLLRPLPFRDPERLVQIWHVPPPQSFPGMKMFSVSAANYVDWHSQNDVFERMAIYTFASFNLSTKDHPDAVQAAAVSSDFFPVLQVQPFLGRVFAPEEDQPGHNNVVILQRSFWQSHFAGDQNIVGQKIRLNSQSYTVIGVMDSRFRFPGWADIWTPMGWTDQERAVRGEHHYQVIARLKPGIDRKRAQAEMDTISQRLAQQYPEDDTGWGAVVVPLREEITSDVRPALLVLLGAVAFVLLIACANVANLVLARAVSRRKEMAVRTALGATRRRVLQQVLGETLLISCAGGTLGLVFAHFGMKLIVDFLSSRLPRTTEISLDAGVLGFTLVVSILTGIVAGLVPALHVTRTDFDLNEALKQGLGRTSADSGGNRARTVFVIAEVALSLVLLVGAGLMVRSLWLLHRVDPGLDPHNVLTMFLPVPTTRFAGPTQEIAFFDQVLQRVQNLPGVEVAGLIDSLPLDLGGGSNQPFVIEGRPAGPMAEQPEVAVRAISAGYLPALRIPILRGRNFTASDTTDKPRVVLISASMAQRFWPNQDPVGHHLILSFHPGVSREVIGVVGDVKQRTLDTVAPVATLYSPVTQISVSSPGWQSFSLALVVRAASSPTTLTSAITHAIRDIDQEQPVVSVMTMDDFVSESLSQQRFNMLLLAAFAGLALLLAAIGIYSVLSYNVRRRVREIGIRMALGAQVGDVLKMIMTEGMKATATGLLIGFVGALALGHVVASLIYEVRPTDPVTFAAVSLLLASVGLLASVIPAYRAVRIDPIVALRDE